MRKILAAALAALLVAQPVLGYRAGQTVPFAFEALNLQGLAATAASAKLLVYKNGVCIDSTKTIGSGIALLPLAGGRSLKTYYGTYTIPTAMGQTTGGGYFAGSLVLQVRYSITGEFTDQSIPPRPAFIPVNAAAADTMYADVLDDFHRGMAVNTEAVISPGYYGATTVTSGGLPYMGAVVDLTSDAAGRIKITSGLSDATGSYVLRVAVSPVASNTFYLWARSGLRTLKSAEVITVP